MDGTSTFVIIVFLATAIERTVEAVISPIFDGLALGKDQGKDNPLPSKRASWACVKRACINACVNKRFVGVVLGLGGGFAVAFGLGLDLFNPLLGTVSETVGRNRATLDSAQAKVFTGILLGGGSAPAHELIRYVEEKKGKAEAEKEAIKKGRPPNTPE